MIYRVYILLSLLSSPFLILWMRYRLFLGKEDRSRYQERYGRPSKTRPKGKLFWFHGASIGECLSFVPVLNHFEKYNPDISFLITSGTRGAADLLKKRLSKKCRHQYVPLDHPLFVARFLKHWKPDACFWTESDFWPNLLIQGSKGRNIFLLNGRFSQRSAATWSFFSFFIIKILNSFTLIFPQSLEDFKRFKSLGLKSLKMIGNLKYEGEKLEVSPAVAHSLRKEISRRPLWIASNTHAGEEEIVLEAHQKLQASLGKKLLLVLIPRHKNRLGTIEEMLINLKLSFVKRSKGKKISEETDVFIVDTLGELGTIYSLSNFVFMAGSLLPNIGGHNILEPARLGALPVFGPYMENNKGMANLLLKNKAAIQLKSSDHLEKTIHTLLKDPKGTKEHAESVVQILKNINILSPIIQEIKRHLP